MMAMYSIVLFMEDSGSSEDWEPVNEQMEQTLEQYEQQEENADSGTQEQEDDKSNASTSQEQESTSGDAASTASNSNEGSNGTSSGSSDSDESDTSDGSTDEEEGLISINTASETQLQTLPGIGPSKATAIIQYREEHGSFQSKEDLKKVKGIGDKTFDKLKALIQL